MKRKADMGMAVLILLAFFAAYLLGRPDPADQHTHDSPVHRANLAPDSAIEPMEDSLMIQYADLMSVPADQLPGFVGKKLDAALQADLDAAFLVHEARSMCWTVPGSEKELEQRIAHMVGNARHALKNEGAIENHQGDSPNLLFETGEENRAHQYRWFLACQQLNQEYESHYRTKVLHLAQGGHVEARYIYAIWPPPDGLQLDDFLNWQEWQSQAQQFSMKNLEEGEVAGALVFAQANLTTHSFLPTRNINNPRALAFFIAARDCGFQSTRIESLIDTLVVMSAPKAEGSSEEMAQILSLAEEIKSYCN